MNSSSIVLSFMLAGFIFLVGHNLIAGPVSFNEASVLKANEKVSSIQPFNQSVSTKNLTNVSIKTAETQL